MRVVEVETSWSLVCVLRTVVFVRSPQKLIDHKKKKKKKAVGREGGVGNRFYPPRAFSVVLNLSSS
jgi:hypothetical protein